MLEEPGQSGTTPPEFRYGEDAPPQLRGKTAQEAAAYTMQLERAIQDLAILAPPAAPAAPEMPPRQPPPQQQQEPYYFAADEPPAPDIDARIDARLGNAAAPLIRSQAALARESASRNVKHEKAFNKFGAEIDAELAKLPPVARIDPNMWGQAADLVAGRHWRELAREEAARLAQQSAYDLTAGGNAVASGAQTGDKLSQLWRENSPYVQWAKSARVTEEMMRRRAEAEGKTPDEYAESLQRSERFHAVGGLEPSTRGTQK